MHWVENEQINTGHMAELVRPIALGLLTESEKKNVAEALNAMVIQRNYKVGTGFLSTPFLLQVLAENGYVDTAYKMLENTQAPGWLAMVDLGATTVWEEYECYDENGSPLPHSFNHYSPGAMCGFLFDTVCGIRVTGENELTLSPMPGGTLTWAEAKILTAYGPVESRWEKRDGFVQYTFNIPANVTAKVILQDGSSQILMAGEHQFLGEELRDMRSRLTDEASISKVIREMTLEEKMNFIITTSPCISFSMRDMDIPPLVLADGATGVNGTHIMLDFLLEKMKQAGGMSPEAGLGMENPWLETQELIAMTEAEALKKAEGNPIKMEFMEFLKNRRNPAGSFISFPSGINIGACFNKSMAGRLGAAIGTEMRSSHLDVCLGPNVDIIRDPLGGRNYEMYGEDPVLVGRIAAAFIRGMQSTGTAACAKHFIANNQETRRQTKDTHVSERTLRELYARGFEKAVKDGGVKAVMSAYNAVNGRFSSYNRTILTNWLKEEWNFDGLVVSDWGQSPATMMKLWLPEWIWYSMAHHPVTVQISWRLSNQVLRMRAE